jgi:hypothetical protein
MFEVAPMVSRESKSAVAGYAAVCVLVSFSAAAAPITEREREDCQADYQRYCRIYPLGSDVLRTCMSRSVRRLSRSCVEALVEAGEMTGAQADTLRRKPGAPHHLRHKAQHHRVK